MRQIASLPDKKKAFRLLLKASKTGQSQAQLLTAECYMFAKGTELNERLAIKYLLLSAKQNNAHAICHLGVALLTGFGINTNKAKAAACFQKSATLGNAHGQYKLGLYYEAAKNEEYAFYCYLASAEKMHKEAQSRVGLYYLHARGGAHQSHFLAMCYFVQAATLGSPQAQCNLALYYMNNTVVGKNQAEAAHWFKLSADQGYTAAEYNYGLCLLNGIGIVKNVELARTYIHKAAAKGSQPASRLLANSH